VLSANEDVEMRDVEDEEEEEEQIATDLDPEEGLLSLHSPMLLINRIFCKQKQVMNPTSKKRKMMKMPRKLQTLATATPNSQSVTKATVLMLCAETTLECLTTPKTILSNITRRSAILQHLKGKGSNLRMYVHFTPSQNEQALIKCTSGYVTRPRYQDDHPKSYRP
jgi:hypothetical protein